MIIYNYNYYYHYYHKLLHTSIHHSAPLKDLNPGAQKNPRGRSEALVSAMSAALDAVEAADAEVRWQRPSTDVGPGEYDSPWVQPRFLVDWWIFVGEMRWLISWSFFFGGG